MKEFIDKLTKAKADIDAGMCRVGPRLEGRRPEQSFLTGGASRAIVLADAIIQLCRREHSAEAGPIVRHLAETAIAMRWVAAEPDAAGEKALRVIAELDSADWDHLWSSERLLRRAGEVGIDSGDLDGILKGAEHFARSGRMILPWAHAFPENNHKGIAAKNVLRQTTRMMGHVTRALEIFWPKNFSGTEELWG